MKALQSQINPHFIYNTLETILWLVEFKENEKAILVVKSLGTILRNTLNINQDFIELSSELLHVQHYMDIQKVRYDDKFDYSLDIDSQVAEFFVPKLILQPIVENAIYHGIKPKKCKVAHKILAYREAEDLITRVENDGLPYQEMNSELKEEFNTYNKQKGIKARMGGIGLKNVSQRIKILCGEAYGLRIFNEKGLCVVEYRLKI